MAQLVKLLSHKPQIPRSVLRTHSEEEYQSKEVVLRLSHAVAACDTHLQQEAERSHP